MVYEERARLARENRRRAFYALFGYAAVVVCMVVIVYVCIFAPP